MENLVLKQRTSGNMVVGNAGVYADGISKAGSNAADLGMEAWAGT
jgi:hypothetical protein